MAFDASLWGQQATHTINVGQVPSSQSNVPLLITKSLASFPSSMLDGGSTSALNGGGDIRVSTDAAGANQLPVEIVSCVTSATPANQELIMWVRVPTVVDSGIIYITWNRAGQSQPPVTDAFGRNAVWSGDNSYHLTNATTTTDAAGSNDLNNTGVTFSAAGANFGAGENYLDSSNNGPSGTASISYSFVLSTTQTGTNRHLLNIGAAVNNSMTYAILNNGAIKFGAWGFDNFGTVTVNDGLEHIVCIVYDQVNYKLYVDGALDTTSASYSSLNISALPFHVGHYRGGGASFAYNGLMRGLRISAGNALTADYIKTEYNNQSNQAAWATIGAPYVPGGSGINVNPLTVNYNITALTADVNAPYDILAATTNYNINALAATVSFSGDIDVTALPANYNITALVTTVAVSGDIDIIPQPANVDYTANNTTVSLFGAIDVNVAVTNYNIEAYQAYVQNETISVECICGYEGVITTSINFDGIITGDIGLNGLIDDSDINRVGAIDNSDLAFKGGLCHCG